MYDGQSDLSIKLVHLLFDFHQLNYRVVANDVINQPLEVKQPLEEIVIGSWKDCGRGWRSTGQLWLADEMSSADRIFSILDKTASHEQHSYVATVGNEMPMTM